MAETESSTPPQAVVDRSAYLTVLLAWVLPGAGHFYLGRRYRAAAFFALVLITLAVGCLLQGNLYRVVPNQPLTILGTLASMGMGAPYFLLRYGVGYSGQVIAASYEYGSAFVLTAGLMNLLLVLDAWDIAQGRKK